MKTTLVIPDAASRAETALPVIRIGSGREPLLDRLREFWRYRELLYFLAWRDVKVRYRQTLLGIAWAILQPLLTMLLFTIFFGKLAGMPSDGIPSLLCDPLLARRIGLAGRALVQSRFTAEQMASAMEEQY